MNRISYRDIFSDLPPQILKKKLKELREKNNIVNVVGFEATKNAIPELDKLYESGKIESRPVHDSGHSFVDWRDESGSEHRHNNLPSTEWREPLSHTKFYMKHGKEHRTNGPSSISSERVAWNLDGELIAQEYQNPEGGYEYYSKDAGDCNLLQYLDALKKYFPSVKDCNWQHELNDNIL